MRVHGEKKKREWKLIEKAFSFAFALETLDFSSCDVNGDRSYARPCEIDSAEISLRDYLGNEIINYIIIMKKKKG